MFVPSTAVSAWYWPCPNRNRRSAHQLSGLNERAFVIGEVVKCEAGKECVELVDMANAVNIGVLVSERVESSGNHRPIEDGTIPARITCVISNNAGATNAAGRKHGIPACIWTTDLFGRESYDTAMVRHSSRMM